MVLQHCCGLFAFWGLKPHISNNLNPWNQVRKKHIFQFKEKTQKFRSSLFKGLQVQDRVLVAARRQRNPYASSAQQGVNQKTVRWTVFWEGTPCARGRSLLTDSLGNTSRREAARTHPFGDIQRIHFLIIKLCLSWFPLFHPFEFHGFRNNIWYFCGFAKAARIIHINFHFVPISERPIMILFLAGHRRIENSRKLTQTE